MLSGMNANFDDRIQPAYDLIKPLIDRIEQLSVEELVEVMKALNLANEDNCPWFLASTRHTLLPLLAIIGSMQDGYNLAWGITEGDS